MAVLDLVVSGRVNARVLITHKFGLDKVQDAIQVLLAADKSLKTVIITALTNEKM
jgi:threonine dehydrogenase-like Zn-dependent dehydrogenase